GGGDMDIAVGLCLLDGLGGPDASVDVVGRPPLEEAHGDAEELGGGAAGEEQDGELVGKAHQLAAVGFRLVQNGDEFLAAMAVLHDADSGAGEAEDVLPGLFKDFEGKGRGAGAEVGNTTGGETGCHSELGIPSGSKVGGVLFTGRAG